MTEGAPGDDLVARVRRVLRQVAAAGGTITYGELLARVPVDDGTDLAPVLRRVSESEDDAGRGLLTAVVVRRSSGLPGGGFFRLAAERGRDTGDRPQAWSAELRLVHESNRPGREP